LVLTAFIYTLLLKKTPYLYYILPSHTLDEMRGNNMDNLPFARNRGDPFYPFFPIAKKQIDEPFLPFPEKYGRK